jgi:hypothetical protein
VAAREVTTMEVMSKAGWNIFKRIDNQNQFRLCCCLLGVFLFPCIVMLYMVHDLLYAARYSLCSLYMIKTLIAETGF